MKLRPGPFPRGARPYVFAGEYFGEPVPGVTQRNGRVAAAVDAAWLLQADGLEAVKIPARPFEFDGDHLRQHTKLYEYQIAGVEHLLRHDYAILADEMGLGKTVQTLVAAEERDRTVRYDASTRVCLILCPALAKRHWQREVKRWTGHDAVILDGLAAGEVPQARYIIANFDILEGQRRRDAAGKMNLVQHLGGWAKQLRAAEFPIIVCDEAHLLRGRDSRRTNAVKEVCEPATCVWLLTGTPMPNHVRDLWSLWDLCSGGLAGPFWPWAKAYCAAARGQYGWECDGASRLDELQKRLSFFVLQRSKSQVGLQLPEKRREIQRVDVEVRPVTSSDAFCEPVALRKTNAVAEALRRTAAAKLPAVVEMACEALAAGQRVVVFTYLRDQAEKIHLSLLGHDFPGQCATGAMSPEQRDMSAQAFREAPGAAAFVATIDSVGVAISLVGADLVIFADLSWEPAKLLQAEGRAHRHGSTNRVLVRYVIASGTIDEEIAESVVDKLDIIQQTLGIQTDGNELAAQLGDGRDRSSAAIVDRLYAKLTGG